MKNRPMFSFTCTSHMCYSLIPQQTIHNCELCPETFTLNKNLLHHIRQEHDGEKYPCDICGAIMSRSDALLVHMRRWHGGQVSHCTIPTPRGGGMVVR